MACCTTVLSCRRLRIPLCTSYIWRNYTLSSTRRNYTSSTNNKEETATKETQIEVKQKNDGYVQGRQDQIFKIKKSPQVNLKKSCGITVEHIKKETYNSELLRHCLEESPDTDGFCKAVDIYISRNKTRRGHIDFISTAMKFIEPYGLEKEMEVYVKLMDVFPRDRFVNRNLLDALLPKPHPQMFLALDLLTKMENQGMIPSREMFDIVWEIFGRASMPIMKIYRMQFWFTEFKDINPYKLDETVYEDRLDIIRAAIDRILGNNDGTKIVEISAPIKEESMINYDHFIISSQTLLQKKYISFCVPTTSIYVEGPSHIWINHKMELYFIMKTGHGELMSSSEITIDPDEEREGVIIGVCFATKPYNETLQRWLQYMQEENVVLKDVNVIFDVTGVSGEKIKVISSA